MGKLHFSRTITRKLLQISNSTSYYPVKAKPTLRGGAVTDEVSAAETTGRELSDNEYLQQLGVEPRFKRALGFLTGSLFAVAFQGPTTGALLITGATLAFGGPAFIWAIPIIFVLQLLLASPGPS